MVTGATGGDRASGLRQFGDEVELFGSTAVFCTHAVLHLHQEHYDRYPHREKTCNELQSIRTLPRMRDDEQDRPWDH
ncbi:MAG: hypothetical protein WDM77_00230 [Steroidobacteraceae bacterium]